MANGTIHFEQITSPGLDPITVYWHDYKLGSGMVTIVCYGSAWTAYFGAMNDRTIREFFNSADVGYLVTKLGITQYLKQNKGHTHYLSKIVTAIKEEIKNYRLVHEEPMQFEIPSGR